MNPSFHFQQPRMTPAVKGLLIAMAVGFVLQLSLHQFGNISAELLLGFSPTEFLHGSFWQILTYPFLHGGLSHILFNALALYFVGPELELRWGSRRFLQYFAICGVGGALLQTLIWGGAVALHSSYAETLGSIPIIGASGALYGLFAAFGALYGEAQVLVFFLFPMKAKQFVLLLAGIELVSAVFYSNAGVANLVHLGGLITGFLYLRWKGNNLDGRGGGGFFRRRAMGRDEVRRRLNLIVNKDDETKPGSGKYPITWN